MKTFGTKMPGGKKRIVKPRVSGDLKEGRQMSGRRIPLYSSMRKLQRKYKKTTVEALMEAKVKATLITRSHVGCAILNY